MSTEEVELLSDCSYEVESEESEMSPSGCWTNCCMHNSYGGGPNSGDDD